MSDESFDDMTLDPVKSSYSNRNVEEELEKRMTRDLLIETILINELDIKKISGKKNGNDQFHKFNIIIKDLVLNGAFTFVEVACFIEETYFDMRSVLKCFNEENLLILKQELLSSHRLKAERGLKRLELED